MASILVIDDDEMVRTYLRDVLEGAGHTVREAADGATGLQEYSREPADVVLCDVFMPGEDGIGVLRKLRWQHQGAKVVSMSGGNRALPKDFLDIALQLGATRVLDKPISPDALLRAVNELVRTPG